LTRYGYGSNKSAEWSQTAAPVKIPGLSLHFGFNFLQFPLHSAQTLCEQAQAVIEIGFLTIVTSPCFVFPKEFGGFIQRSFHYASYTTMALTHKVHNWGKNRIAG